MSDADLRTPNIREKLARIDRMLMDQDRERREMRLAPWALLTSGAAIFAAGAAFAMLMGR